MGVMSVSSEPNDGLEVLPVKFVIKTGITNSKIAELVRCFSSSYRPSVQRAMRLAAELAGLEPRLTRSQSRALRRLHRLTLASIHCCQSPTDAGVNTEQQSTKSDEAAVAGQDHEVDHEETRQSSVSPSRKLSSNLSQSPLSSPCSENDCDDTFEWSEFLLRNSQLTAPDSDQLDASFSYQECVAAVSSDENCLEMFRFSVRQSELRQLWRTSVTSEQYDPLWNASPRRRTKKRCSSSTVATRGTKRSCASPRRPTKRSRVSSRRLAADKSSVSSNMPAITSAVESLSGASQNDVVSSSTAAAAAAAPRPVPIRGRLKLVGTARQAAKSFARPCRRGSLLVEPVTVPHTLALAQLCQQQQQQQQEQEKEQQQQQEQDKEQQQQEKEQRQVCHVDQSQPGAACCTAGLSPVSLTGACADKPLCDVPPGLSPSAPVAAAMVSPRRRLMESLMADVTKLAPPPADAVVVAAYPVSVQSDGAPDSSAASQPQTHEPTDADVDFDLLASAVGERCSSSQQQQRPHAADNSDFLAQLQPPAAELPSQPFQQQCQVTEDQCSFLLLESQSQAVVSLLHTPSQQICDTAFSSNVQKDDPANVCVPSEIHVDNPGEINQFQQIHCQDNASLDLSLHLSFPDHDPNSPPLHFQPARSVLCTPTRTSPESLLGFSSPTNATPAKSSSSCLFTQLDSMLATPTASRSPIRQQEFGQQMAPLSPTEPSVGGLLDVLLSRSSVSRQLRLPAAGSSDTAPPAVTATSCRDSDCAVAEQKGTAREESGRTWSLAQSPPQRPAHPAQSSGGSGSGTGGGVRLRARRSRQQLKEWQLLQTLLAEEAGSRQLHEQHVACCFFQRIRTETCDSVYDRVQELLASFPLDGSGNQLALFDQLHQLLTPYEQLLAELPLFFGEHVAVQRGQLLQRVRAQQLVQLARRLQLAAAAKSGNTNKMRRALEALYVRVSRAAGRSDGQTARALTLQLHALLQPVLRSCPQLLQQLQQQLATEPPPHQLYDEPDQFQTVSVGELTGSQESGSPPAAVAAAAAAAAPPQVVGDGAFDDLSTLQLPPPDLYATDRCPCSCHSQPGQAGGRLGATRRHCLKCGLKFFDGRVFLQTGKVLRPARIVYHTDSGTDRQRAPAVPAACATPTQRRRAWSRREDFVIMDAVRRLGDAAATFRALKVSLAGRSVKRIRARFVTLMDKLHQHQASAEQQQQQEQKESPSTGRQAVSATIAEISDPATVGHKEGSDSSTQHTPHGT